MAEEPTLRMMWVWNDNVENKEKIKVAYVNNGCTFINYRRRKIRTDKRKIQEWNNDGYFKKIYSIPII